MSARVLVVDDDPEVLDAIRAALGADVGERPLVETALSGGEALEKLQAGDYRFVLADYRMPGMDGIEFLEKVRKERPGAVRGLITGFHDLDIALAAVERAAVHYYVQKPWDNAELRSVVREALARGAGP